MDHFSDREKEVLQIILKVLCERLNLKRIILFGSRAEGRSRKESDFDVAIDSLTPDFRARRQVAEAIDLAIGLYKADLVYLNAVEPSFRDLVHLTGKVIYERKEDRSAA